MKKFLISLILGVTMMAIGGTMLLFEVKGFKVIDDLSVLSDTQQKTYSVKNIDTIIFKDYPDYTWDFDESLDDEIKIYYTSTVEVDLDGKNIYIQRENQHALEQIDIFLDGLKDKRVYTNEAMNQVKIVSSSKTYDNIKIIYE